MTDVPGSAWPPRMMRNRSGDLRPVLRGRLARLLQVRDADGRGDPVADRPDPGALPLARLRGRRRDRGHVYAGPHNERAGYMWSVNVAAYVREGTRRSGVGLALSTSFFALLRLQGFVNAYAGITLPNRGASASTGGSDSSMSRRIEGSATRPGPAGHRLVGAGPPGAAGTSPAAPDDGRGPIAPRLGAGDRGGKPRLTSGRPRLTLPALGSPRARNRRRL